MTDRITLEDFNNLNNIENQRKYPCGNCGRSSAPFELVDVRQDPAITGDFACGFCLIDKERKADLVAMQAERIPLTWEDVRSLRNRLLARCDWTQTFDVDEAIRNEWAPLRLRLRNITEEFSDVYEAYDALLQIEVDSFTTI